MGLIGRMISPAVMLRYIAELGEFLKSWEEQMKEKILESEVIHVDETSMRVKGKNYWIHTLNFPCFLGAFIHRFPGGTLFCNWIF